MRSELKARIADLQGQLANTTQELNTRIADLQGQLANTTQELNARIAELQEKLTNAQEKLTNAQEVIHSHAATILELRASSEETNNLLDNERALHEKKCEALEAATNSFSESRKKQEAELRSTQEELAATKEREAALARTLAEREAELGNSNTQIEQLQAAKRNLEQEKARLEGEVDRHVQALAALTIELEENKAELEGAQAGFKVSVDRINENLRGALNEANRLRSENSKLESRVRELEALKEELTGNIERVNEALSNLTQKHRKLLEEHKELLEKFNNFIFFVQSRPQAWKRLSKADIRAFWERSKEGKFSDLPAATATHRSPRNRRSRRTGRTSTKSEISKAAADQALRTHAIAGGNSLSERSPQGHQPETNQNRSLRLSSLADGRNETETVLVVCRNYLDLKAVRIRLSITDDK